MITRSLVDAFRTRMEIDAAQCRAARIAWVVASTETQRLARTGHRDELADAAADEVRAARALCLAEARFDLSRAGYDLAALTLAALEGHPDAGLAAIELAHQAVAEAARWLQSVAAHQPASERRAA